MGVDGAVNLAIGVGEVDGAGEVHRDMHRKPAGLAVMATEHAAGGGDIGHRQLRTGSALVAHTREHASDEAARNARCLTLIDQPLGDQLGDDLLLALGRHAGERLDAGIRIQHGILSLGADHRVLQGRDLGADEGHGRYRQRRGGRDARGFGVPRARGRLVGQRRRSPGETCQQGGADGKADGH